jgi:1,4-dihydroxy-2-naphthoate octaprenyltransferase
MKKRIPSLSSWWRAFRFHFVPPSFLPAILGGVSAWAITGKFNLLYFVITVVCVVCNHIALNMTDDYFDYRHRVDRAGGEGKNPYSGGSGTLTSGLITPGQMLFAFVSLYALTAAGGIYLTVMRGWPVLLFGLVGVLSAYFYTAPPVRYAYYGLGELSQLVNFSAIIGLGSYFVQAQSVSWEALLAVLPLGFMMFSMITINEIPDESQDSSGDKRTLVVMFGSRAGVWLYSLGMAAAYLTVIVSVLTGITSAWTVLSLLTLPLFLNALFVLVRNYRDPLAMSPANVMTIRVHNLTGILLIIAYVVQGGVEGRPAIRMIVPLALLVCLQLPVFLTHFFVKAGKMEPAAST